MRGGKNIIFKFEYVLGKTLNRIEVMFALASSLRIHVFHITVILVTRAKINCFNNMRCFQLLVSAVIYRI